MLSTCRRRLATLFLPLFFVLYVSELYSAVFGDETTRYGACLIRAELGETELLPKITFSDDAANAGWKLVHGAAFTGVDARRLYLTIEAPGSNVSAPVITVEWPGVKIERVLGAAEIRFSENSVQFKPVSTKAPTESFTEMTFGAVHLGVFHNWEIRRCGPYRDGPYPDVELRAHLNYLLATLEVCRAYGWTDVSKPDFVDHINLYGVETHFPNGHRDYPVHFHIMLAWDGWAAAQVGHYHIDPQGRIINNAFWSLHKDVERFDGRGVTTPYRDKTDRLIFETTILNDGTGLIISRPEDDKVYLIRAGITGASDSVEVCVRPKSGESDAWTILCDVKANDDVANGVFFSKASYADGTAQTVSFSYDPDTGARRNN